MSDTLKAEAIANLLWTRMSPQLQQFLTGPAGQMIAQTFARSAGPAIFSVLTQPVQVQRVRDDEDDSSDSDAVGGDFVTVKTTLPQLLAEMNDNLLDLIEEMQELRDSLPASRRKKK